MYEWRLLLKGWLAVDRLPASEAKDILSSAYYYYFRLRASKIFDILGELTRGAYSAVLASGLETW